MRRLLAVVLALGCDTGFVRAPVEDLAPLVDLKEPAPRGATHLVIVNQPSGVAVDEPLGAMLVEARDDDENVVQSFAAPVNVQLGTNASDSTLLGTLVLPAAFGRVEFPDLRIDHESSALTVLAGARGIASARTQPFPVAAARWRSVPGLHGGSAVDLVADPLVAERVWMATPRRGVWRSSTSGATWATVAIGLGDPRILDLAIAPAGTLYAATQSGLYRLFAGANAWVALELGTIGAISAVAVAPSDAQTLYACAAGRIVRSDDGGATFSTSLATLAATHLLTSADDARVLFASDGAAIWKSSDGGARFSAWSNGLPATTVRGLAADATGRLFAATDAGGFVLAKGESDWSAAGTGPARAVTTSGDSAYFLDDQGLLQRNINGVLQRLAPFSHPRPRALAVSGSTPRSFNAGTEGGGNFRLVEGGSFTPAVMGLDALEVRALAFAGGNLVAAADGGLFRSTDAGGRFDPVAVGAFRAVFARPSGFIAFDGALAFVSSDGASFLRDSTFDDCGALAVDGATTYCTPLSASVIGLYQIQGGSRALLANGIDAHLTHVAFENLQLWVGGATGAWRSTDSGASFSKVRAAAVTALHADGGKLWLADAAGITVTSDGGVSFAPVRGPGGARALLDDGARLWAAADTLYVSDDQGASFSPSRSGLRGLSPSSLALVGTTLLVGTIGGGVFR